MKLPKYTLLSLLPFLVINLTKGFSQKDTVKKWRTTLDVAIVLNKSFSQISESYGEGGHYGSTRITENKTAPPTKLGFNIGQTTNLKMSNHIFLILGGFASITQNSYIRVSSFSNPNSLYVSTWKHNDAKITTTFIWLNHEIGFKFRLFRKFFAQHTFLLNQNIQAFGVEKGLTTTTESSHYPDKTGYPANYSNSTQVSFYNKTQNWDGNYLSTRLSLFYGFSLSKKECAIYLFRNFAIRHKLPWWGLGFSFTL